MYSNYVNEYDDGKCLERESTRLLIHTLTYILGKYT